VFYVHFKSATKSPWNKECHKSSHGHDGHTPIIETWASEERVICSTTNGSLCTKINVTMECIQTECIQNAFRMHSIAFRMHSQQHANRSIPYEIDGRERAIDLFSLTNRFQTNIIMNMRQCDTTRQPAQHDAPELNAAAAAHHRYLSASEHCAWLGS
jgi:hypothetical protein